MQWNVGTSGFSYDEWAGSFYPEDLPGAERLAYYAERLPSVEINNTFYRMPKPALLDGWAGQVPNDFALALKAPRRITHIKKIRDVADDVGYLDKVASSLGEHRGPILFQLPPYLRKDVALLRDFLALLPPGCRAVLEFRHASWLDDEVYEALRAARVALCVADAGEDFDAPLLATAPFGYLRLRRQDYDEATLASWAERIRTQPWQDVMVFFKHEEAGIGPALAARFRSLFVDGRSLRAPAWRADADRPAATAAPPRRRASRRV